MDLRSVVDAVAQGLTSLGQAPQGAHGRIWEESRAYVTRLLVSVSQKWLPYYTQGELCSVKVLKSGVPFPCGGTAVLPCGACGSPACLHHAQVDQHGDGTCYTCIGSIMAQKRAERMAGNWAPGQASGSTPVDMTRELVKRALKELGLEPGASWEEIRQAHRKKAAASHPDGAKTEAARRKREEASKRVNSAFADLQRHYRPEGARVA